MMEVLYFMETIYVYNRSLEARLNKLTFGELKEMFPTVSTALYLPRPESLLENRKNRSIRDRVEELVRVPCRCKRARLSLSVTYDNSSDKVRIVKYRTECVGY